MRRLRKESETSLPFMVRYLTTNGTSDRQGRFKAFVLMYRSLNESERDFLRMHQIEGSLF